MEQRPLPARLDRLEVGELGYASSQQEPEGRAKVTIDFDISPADFRERFFEKDFWLARGALPPVHRFGLAEIAHILRSLEPVSPHLQLFDQGRIEEEAFTHWTMTDGVPRRRLDERYGKLVAQGATTVLNNLEMHSTAARRLCDAVKRFAGFPTRANAYVSFGGAGSFGAHWDTHDVFVLQLVGCKRWRVSEPTFPLPLPAHPSRGSGQTAPSQPALDTLLEAGDLLYLPRGWWHEVTPLPEPSVHLSVGVYVPSVFDVLNRLCRQVLPHELAARRSAVDEAQTGRDLAALLEALNAAVGNPELRASLRRELIEARRAPGES